MVALNPQPRRFPLFPLADLHYACGNRGIGEGGQPPEKFLAQHVTGDWGNLCDDDNA